MGWTPRPGGFHADGDGLRLVLEDGERPPPRATLEVWAGRNRRENGRLRVRGARFHGEGFALLPGERIERRADLPPRSALRFAACVEPLAEDRRPVTFRVTLDGEPLYECAIRDASRAASSRHVVPLPRGGRDDALLGFEVLGALAHSAFLEPVVGPLDPPAERVDTDERPDLVVFLADTFRADNLTAYGGELGLTPHLDRFARESITFARAWSPGTFTLPGHSALFGGAWPRQVGSGGTGRALPRAVTTIAELLAERGYRTGGITEAVLVSGDYGFDQGFAWWDERWGGLDDTLARAQAFLDAGDGRPTFLFVQTYRTHTPYVASDAARAAVAERLEVHADWHKLQQRIVGLRERSPGPSPQRTQLAWRARDLYRAAAFDLDLGFAAFRDDLARRGLDRTGWLVFTSDHGEAFYEHDALYHPGRPWEELARVPLIVHGPGQAPRTVDTAGSLVDVAPTLAALAGVPPLDTWVGRSLLAPGGDRPVFLFECGNEPELSSVAVVDGTYKAFASEGGVAGGAVPEAAFDLAADPLEQRDLARGATWPDELFERHRAALRDALEPHVTPEDAALGSGRVDELRAMGYAGDD
jgi:arylsulfatase